ncbi:hypothetical protein [Bradyrhizobium sp. 170]|uniref:hypothetical protein n=1 Tax=Bradyrhizobium sp. 170 TaxID=2782641 RepID=UPI00200056C8|nr:hypothetical protein [Bradyrhizobium sp. 170]UPK01399.1 hypothetical protein IVB05_27430 [Bradyrhizobium sp. 170]
MLNRNLGRRLGESRLSCTRGWYGSAQKEKQSAAKGGIVPEGMIERGAPRDRSNVDQAEIGAWSKRSDEKRGYLSPELDHSSVNVAPCATLPDR